MKRSEEGFVAGGGLVDRRSFLLAGATFMAASSLRPAHAAEDAGNAHIGSNFPTWMRTLGQQDVGYGQPVSHESHVQKQPQSIVPETSGFTLWHTPIETQRGAITPNGLHFGVHHNGIPDIDPARHELLIHGLVDRPLKFSMESLLRYPMVSRILFLECSGNTAANALSPFARDVSCQELFGQVSGSEWVGVPLRSLLREAGIKPSAKWAIAEGADGGSHARSIPISKLLDDAMLAMYQNGERLRGAQGYPLRLLLPGWEGNTNVKWLHRLELSDAPAYTKDESGLYTEFLADGGIARFSFPMDVKSVITHPAGTQLLGEKGFYEISGLAWSGHGKISRVEVSADQGKSWATTDLQGPILDRALTRFSIPWRWDGKSTVLLSRATDERGVQQPTRNEWKSRYASHSFNHYNAIQTWRIGRDGRVENVYA